VDFAGAANSLCEKNRFCSTQGAIRRIRFIREIRVPPLNLDASLQALNSEF